jgi:transposase InsO family protein
LQLSLYLTDLARRATVEELVRELRSFSFPPFAPVRRQLFFLVLRSDNGPEFIAYAIQDWLRDKNVKTIYVTPGAPWENAYIETCGQLLHYTDDKKRQAAGLWRTQTVAVLKIFRR